MSAARFYDPEAPVQAEQLAKEFGRLLRLYRWLKPLTVLEIGSYRGGSLYQWITNARAGARIVAVDLPGGAWGDTAEQDIGQWRGWAEGRAELTVIQADSGAFDTFLAVARACPRFDFIFVDGDHRHDAARLDFERYWPLVSPSGVMAWHDALKTDDECGVPQLLGEVSGYAAAVDLFTSRRDQDNMGIALLWKSPELGRALAGVKSVLDGLDIPFWLDGGTLLGAVRDNGFIPGDHDIDVSCWDEQYTRRDEIVAELEAAGFALFEEYTEPSRELRFRRGRVTADIFFINRTAEWAWLTVRSFEDPNAPRVVYKRTPRKHFDRLDRTAIRGEVYRIPSEVESYLALKYGDWRRPVPAGSWDCAKDDLSIVESVAHGAETRVHKHGRRPVPHRPLADYRAGL